MSSDTTYAESVASCRVPTPLDSPPPAAAAAVGSASRLPVRRQLDFPGGGELDDDEDFLFRAAEETERSYSEAKHRASQDPVAPPPVAPPAFREKQCICGRGPCDVAWKRKEREGWAYICSALPKCNHFSWCEESDLNPNPQPAFRSHPEPNNPCVFNSPSNQKAGARTPVNVSPHGAGATTPVNDTQGARSNGKSPVCKCTAGECRTVTLKGQSYYVCRLEKGQGACSHLELLNAAAEEPPQTGNNNPMESKYLEYSPAKNEANGHNLVSVGANNKNRSVNPDQPEDDEWRFDIVDNDIGRLEPAHPTPVATKSPLPPKSLGDHQVCCISPVTPRSSVCYRCGKDGHWSKDCTNKPLTRCFECDEVGHWRKDCPVLHGKRG